MAKLLKHPNVMKEVQREIRGFDKDKDHITENDLEEMKYLIKSSYQRIIAIAPTKTLISIS